jgi:hypothetical protein
VAYIRICDGFLRSRPVRDQARGEAGGLSANWDIVVLVPGPRLSGKTNERDGGHPFVCIPAEAGVVSDPGCHIGDGRCLTVRDLGARPDRKADPVRQFHDGV